LGAGKPGTFWGGVTRRVGSGGGTASFAGGDIAVALGRAHPRQWVLVVKLLRSFTAAGQSVKRQNHPSGAAGLWVLPPLAQLIKSCNCCGVKDTDLESGWPLGGHILQRGNGRTAAASEQRADDRDTQPNTPVVRLRQRRRRTRTRQQRRDAANRCGLEKKTSATTRAGGRLEISRWQRT